MIMCHHPDQGSERGVMMCHHPDLGSEGGGVMMCHHPDQGSDTSSVWNRWARSLDVISGVGVIWYPDLPRPREKCKTE